MNNPLTIYTVDGVCGSFKTTQALQWAVQQAKNGYRLVIASPSMVLAEQSFTAARALDPEVPLYRFDSTTHPEHVYHELAQFMMTFDETPEHGGGCVVFITHKCLFDMPYWGRSANTWHLVIDEIPQPDSDYWWKVSFQKTKEFLLDPLDAVECGENLYMQLVAKDVVFVKNVAANKEDDVMMGWLGEYRDLCQQLVSGNHTVYVSRTSWNELRYTGSGYLHLHAVRNPEALKAWGSVHIMGAHFDQSVLAMIWSAQGVIFKPSRYIKPVAAAHDHRLGERIELLYFNDSNRPWSRKLFSSLGREGDAIDAGAVEALHPLFTAAWGDNPFLYWLNNAVPAEAVQGAFKRAVRAPNNPHGINHFRHHDKAAFLTCLNATSPHYKFLEAMYGISAQRLAQGRYYEFAYQAFMRTCARDAASTTKCSFLIPDRDAAVWFQDVFPGSTMTKLKVPDEVAKILLPRNKGGRPRQVEVMSPTERSRRSRAKSAEICASKRSIYDRGFRCTKTPVLSHKATAYATDVVEDELPSWDHFRDQMHRLWQIDKAKKEDNCLVGGASYGREPDADNGILTRHGLANITAVRGLFFDIDEGTMSPDDWAMVFPEYKFFAHNSFNNGVDGKRKYRVFFPTSEPLSAEQHHYVWDVLSERIKQAGFYIGTKASYDKLIRPNTQFSGIDTTKRTASSWFYTPCQAGKGTKFSFWSDHWGEDRAIMDVADLLKLTMMVKAEFVVPEKDTSQDEDETNARKVSSALRKWDAGKPGHEEFVELAVTGAHAFTNRQELHAMLAQAAHRDPQGTRRHEVDEITRWAWQSRQRR